MQLRSFSPEDVPAFLDLAGAEGWVCDRWEFGFLLETFPRGCFCAVEDGRPVAFVTSVCYGASGWIGNLLVEEGKRGRGYGTLLMRRSLDELLAVGASTVWLTASLAGRPIYEKMGFREIDQVTRWAGRGAGKACECADTIPLGEMIALDRAGWGDDRQTILAAVATRGTLLRGSGGFLVVQRCGNDFQLGPWSGGGRRESSALLKRALSVVDEGDTVVLDVPVRNVDAAALLNASGFAVVGRTSLMVVGDDPAYEPTRIFALASMGSMG
ncbi:MAG: GNAT family N-acetyltransferase [Desulfuromonadales bacterium]|nr:MAG: GNAT family N-acetyltransferase [Desulfuromonadales bacterium]